VLAEIMKFSNHNMFLEDFRRCMGKFILRAQNRLLEMLFYISYLPLGRESD